MLKCLFDLYNGRGWESKPKNSFKYCWYGLSDDSRQMMWFYSGMMGLCQLQGLC